MLFGARQLSLWLGLTVLLGSALISTPIPTRASHAQEMRYIRIGAGPVGESHFQLDGLIISAISAPSCDPTADCGVPGLIAAAPTTSGSVADVTAVAEGLMDAALVQSDVAWWASGGKPPYDGHPLKSLRSIANFYSDAIHLVVRRGSPIHAPKDLVGKRVSLGGEGSGTLVHARLVLAAWGLSEKQIKSRFLSGSFSADALAKGDIDAFFIMDGSPTPAVAALAKQMPLRLIPIDGATGKKMIRADPLLVATSIPGGTYAGIPETVPTLQVAVSLVVSVKMPDELVYGITKALSQPETLRQLAENRRYDAAVTVGDFGVPLHDGARRYYREAGLIN